MGSPTFGRFVCVLLPFVLTAGAIVAMLVAALAGVADKGLYSFQLNTTNMTISPLDIKNILGDQISVGGVTVDLNNGNVNGNINGVPVSNDNGNIQVGNNNFNTNTGTGNIGGNQINTNNIIPPRDAELEMRQVPGLNVNLTTESLGLADLYDVHMWGYCYTFLKNNSRECTQPKFNWANNIFNITRNGDVATVLTQTGVNVTLPKEIVRAADVFVDVARWTQILFVISLGSLALNIIFGAAANCTRIMSCIAWLVASVAAVATIAAAGLATATAAVVVGTVESTAKFYGVGGHMNTRFLVSVWIGAACAIGAAFFFLFTICCCAPDKSRRNRRSVEEGEKLMGGSPYQPVNPGGYQGGYAGGPAAPVGRAGAYEPYSHRG